MTKNDKYVNEMDWANGDDGFSLFNNYRKYQFNLIKDYIGHNILEIGSGDRSFTNQILQNIKHNFNLLSIEPSQTLFNFGKKRDHFPNNFNFTSSDLFDMDCNADIKFDTVLMIHVLEHIQKDKEALDHVYSLMDSGGRLLIQVPAYQWLYSEHDKSLGHFKRYNKQSIEKIIDKRKYRITKIWYQDPIGILGSLIYFKLKKTTLKSDDGGKLIKKQGMFYDKIVIPIEHFIEKFITFPFGLNLTIVLTKI